MTTPTTTTAPERPLTERVAAHIAEQRAAAGLEPVEIRLPIMVNELEAHADALGIDVGELVLGALGGTLTDLASGEGASVAHVRMGSGRECLHVRISGRTLEVRDVDPDLLRRAAATLSAAADRLDTFDAIAGQP